MADKKHPWNHGPVPAEVTPAVYKHAKANMPEDQWHSYREHFDAGLEDYKAKEVAKAEKAPTTEAKEEAPAAKEAKGDKK